MTDDDKPKRYPLRRTRCSISATTKCSRRSSRMNRRNYARLLNSVLHKGDDWKNMPKVYQISLVNFIFDKDDKSAVSHYRMQKNNGHLLSGIQTIIFLELLKISALGAVLPESLNSEQKWRMFFWT